MPNSQFGCSLSDRYGVSAASGVVDVSSVVDVLS